MLNEKTKEAILLGHKILDQAVGPKPELIYDPILDEVVKIEDSPWVRKMLEELDGR